ncbi:hypothetical protein B0H11DRAFT_2287112 [Mycena galericulata]|nr:hypothetical protein B0H11DRAFT_2287112 [Mycena galericulata]
MVNYGQIQGLLMPYAATLLLRGACSSRPFAAPGPRARWAALPAYPVIVRCLGSSSAPLTRCTTPPARCPALRGSPCARLYDWLRSSGPRVALPARCASTDAPHALARSLHTAHVERPHPLVRRPLRWLRLPPSRCMRLL